VSKGAHKIWSEKVERNKSPKHVTDTVLRLNQGMCDVDGIYMFVYKNRDIEATIKDNYILFFKIKNKLEITAHAYSRWRDRVDNSCSNKDIYEIFERLDDNAFDPTVNAKYLMSYKDKKIIAVILNNKIITFIPPPK
jgi:hypothetical protein